MSIKLRISSDKQGRKVKSAHDTGQLKLEKVNKILVKLQWDI